MKKVVLVSNLRMLLIFLLLNSDDLDNICFIFDSSFSSDKKLKKNLLLKEKKRFKRIASIFFDYFKLKKLNLSKNVKVYGADHIRGANFFLKRYEFYLIEDGMMNYAKQTYKRTIKNLLFSKPKLGRDKNVKKIYLTGLAQIPEAIKDKVEIVDLKKLWKLKTKEEQEEILEVFGFDREILEKIKEKNIILFTQPLSEDGILNEQEKIELYSKIILKYPKEKLIIKTHPREKTNYSKVFNEIYILEQNFPAEIFKLLEISFKKGVTLFSTAVLTNNCKEIDFYGTEVHPNLLKKFGSMDHIMKRNKFL
ncbi:MAG: glycosyltransferase family 52 protein [Fusobacterium mortiferum]|nr:glycosyltransferase family 52 protein [Fusobacterium mortiferum]